MPSSLGVHFNKRSSEGLEGAFLQRFAVLKSTKVPGDAENAHRWNLLFTPGVRLRVSSDRTQPRSPSYVPRIDFQKLRLYDHGGTVSAWEWHAGVGHTAYRQFSTNDVRGGMNFRHNLVDKDGRTTRDWSAGLEYQRQFATNANLKPTYSINRVHGTVAAAWRDLPWPGRLKTEMNIGVALDRSLKSAVRWSLAPRVAWYPGLQTGLGLFARFYHGEDYFHLHSTAAMPNSIQIGLEFEQDGFLKFKPR